MRGDWHMTQYQVGNTVRLTAEFRDFDDILTDPTLVKIKFMDGRYTQTLEVTLNSSNRISVGKYKYDYVIPLDSDSTIYYEWYAEINGKPSLKRSRLNTTML